MRSCKPAGIAALWFCCAVTASAQPQAIAPARPVPPAVLSVVPDLYFEDVSMRIFVDGDYFCDETGSFRINWGCEGPMSPGAHLVTAYVQADNQPIKKVEGTILLMPGDWVEHDPSQAPDFKYWCISVSMTEIKEMSKYDRDCEAS